MNNLRLHTVNQWFRGYTQNIVKSLDDFDQSAIEFKLSHSERVRQMISRLSPSLGLDQHEQSLAETIALLHDVGRIPQWAMWKTYNDAVSANHGALGAAVLKDFNVLAGYSAAEQDLIYKVIEFHNALTLPPSLTEKETFFLRLTRDADRLDIFSVHASYRQGENTFLDKQMQGDLAGGNAISDEIIDRLLAREMPHKRLVKTGHDLALITLGWVFDLSFPPCHQIVIENSFVELILQKLPKNDKIQRLTNTLRYYLAEHALDPTPNPTSSYLQAGAAAS